MFYISEPMFHPMVTADIESAKTNRPSNAGIKSLVYL